MNRVSIGSDNGLLPILCRANIWANDGIGNWRMHASLDLNENKISTRQNQARLFKFTRHWFKYLILPTSYAMLPQLIENNLHGGSITRIYSYKLYEQYFHLFDIRCVQAFSLKIYCDFNIEPHCLYISAYQICPPPTNSSRNIQKQGHFKSFSAVATWKKYRGLILLICLFNVFINFPIFCLNIVL